MFLGVKKRFLSFFILWILFFVGGKPILFSQNESSDISYHKKIYIQGKTLYLPIYLRYHAAKELDDRTYEKKVSDSLDYTAVEWSNHKFNPYKGKLVHFPFRLNFKDSIFTAPIDRKLVVTSRYGWRRGRPHQGIDIDLQIGDTVRTLLEGKVRYARYHGGHGKTLVVRHPNGLETIYAHLSSFLVKENQMVKKGQAIAKGGITGNARGSHLHLEVKYHGKNINPEYLFEFSDTTSIRSDIFMVTRKWATPHYHKSTRKSTIIVHKSEKDLAILKEQQQKVYTVKKGDNLYRISLQHGLPIAEICKLNAIRRNSVLKIGQQIILAYSQ